MKKIIALAILVLFAMSTVSAYAASSSKSTSSSSEQGGWQYVYDEISTWKWGMFTKKTPNPKKK